MAHDPVVQSFWPQLYDQYPDFQLWVVDREAGRRGRRLRVQRARAVGRDPSPRGIDWALTDGVEGDADDALCAIVAGVVPEYRGFGIARDDPAAAGRDRRRPTGSTRWSRRCGRRGRSAIRSSPIDRYVGLAARRRPPVRPVATHARAARRRDPRAGAALDDDHGHARGVGGVDGDGVPRGRRLRRPGRARAGALQERIPVFSGDPYGYGEQAPAAVPAVSPAGGSV